jgi:hypothetical protein
MTRNKLASAEALFPASVIFYCGATCVVRKWKQVLRRGKCHSGNGVAVSHMLAELILTSSRSRWLADGISSMDRSSLYGTNYR